MSKHHPPIEVASLVVVNASNMDGSLGIAQVGMKWRERLPGIRKGAGIPMFGEASLEVARLGVPREVVERWDTTIPPHTSRSLLARWGVMLALKEATTNEDTIAAVRNEAHKSTNGYKKACKALGRIIRDCLTQPASGERRLVDTEVEVTISYRPPEAQEAVDLMHTFVATSYTLE